MSGAAIVAIAAALHSTGAPAASGPTSSEQAAACTTDIRVIPIDRATASRVIAKVPEYTQGLIFSDDALYEGTGAWGRSAIYRLDLKKGVRSELVSLDRNLFGEGLARLGERFYQLTWRAGLAFVYEPDADGNGLTRVTRFERDGEGWGLTDLDGELVLSDGSDYLSFIDPQTFAVTRTVQARLGSRPVPYLNELEAVGNVVLANVYGQSSIIAIDPANGCVTAVIDASGLVADMAAELEALSDPICTGSCNDWDFVLNGIAYDANRRELYITGKNWPAIFVYRDLLG